MTRRNSRGTASLGREAQQARARVDGEACLIRLYPPGPELGQRTRLEADKVVLGRDPDIDMVVASDAVSRRHARLWRGQQGDWHVEDLGSTNGSFVNDERVDVQRLRNGDQIRVGDVIFKFLSGGHIESAYHEEIYRMTILDGLTGVHNKRYFEEFLERELARSRRHRHPLTLAMMDVDHFKNINDERGHLAGDAVLRELAGRVRPRIRREDLLARFGGEEFAVLLTVTDLAGGALFAEQLREIVGSRPFSFEGETFEVTVSVGVAQAPIEGPCEPTDLVKRADENLYAAKRGGRNRVVG